MATKNTYSPPAVHGGFYHLDRQGNDVWNWFEKVIPGTGVNRGEDVSVPAEVDQWVEVVE